MSDVTTSWIIDDSRSDNFPQHAATLSQLAAHQKDFSAILTRNRNFLPRCPTCSWWLARYAFFIPSRAFNKTIRVSSSRRATQRNASAIFLFASIVFRLDGTTVLSKLSTKKVQRDICIFESRKWIVHNRWREISIKNYIGSSNKMRE